MKFIVACLLLGSSAVTLAEEEDSRLTFPPFSGEDLSIPNQPLPSNLTFERRKEITAEEWRGIMSSGNAMDQGTAMRELLERGDQKTILRLVYSMKQGNIGGELMLFDTPSLLAIPYLMEDVAHGGLNYYGTYTSEDAGFGVGRVRVAAAKFVASVLANSEKFTGETKNSLRAIERGGTSRVQALSDVSRYLLQWWLLNESAFEAGKWDEVKPLPQEIIYGAPKNDTYFPRDENWDPKKQPPFGSPAWDLPESFEAWAERIMDPKRRNLDFVALSWDGTKVVEHPAKSLDSRSRPSSPREPRKALAPRNPSKNEPVKVVGSWKGISWAALAAVFILVLSIVHLVRRKPATKD